jgi:murein DD-endopeptidase MepM/ murein hydrolase activator NlpD
VAAANKRQAAESQPNQPEVNSSKPDPGNSDSGSSSGGGGGGSDAGAASPVPGAVIGSRFGEYGSWSRYHTGLDFRASYGTPIRAVKAGVVLYAGNSGDWAGNHVAIKHGDGMTTMSSHMSSMAVHAGQTVQAGQIIGRVGQTGRAFGAHLHFELYPAGVKYGDVYKAINPQPWLNANGVATH